MYPQMMHTYFSIYCIFKSFGDWVSISVPPAALTAYTLGEWPYCLRECSPSCYTLCEFSCIGAQGVPAKCRFNVVLRYTFSAYRAKDSKGVRWMVQYKTSTGLTWCCFTSARQYVTCVRICYSDSISSIGSSRISAIVSTLISVALSFLA